MRAKRTVDGTDIRTEKTGAAFNLKTKRLNMGGTKVTFNEINCGGWVLQSLLARTRITYMNYRTMLRCWTTGTRRRRRTNAARIALT